ncbi:MAG: beta-ketoacyl-ACP synthase III [Clostridiaceae bacterium]|nr:beta-ketoacyl-ACP synthase III [Clostridiaceae bacterium]
MNFRILGTGRYLPERVVPNDELARYVDTNDEWIRRRVGIAERRVCTTETTAELAFRAAKNALEQSGVGAGELDWILAATTSGDCATPGLSCMVQAALGATCPALDINAACPAFLLLLETAAGFFARGNIRRILVVSAERMSRVTDWHDRSTCVIFGDGAGAAVLGEGEGYLGSVVRVSGGDDVLRIPLSRGNSPFYTGHAEEPYVHMNGQETFKFAVSSICRDIRDLLGGAGLNTEDIRRFVFHQANARILEYAREKLKIPPEKCADGIERYGNTSSASVPIALDELNRAGELSQGDLVVLSAFGAGLSSAATLIRW